MNYPGKGFAPANMSCDASWASGPTLTLAFVYHSQTITRWSEIAVSTHQTLLSLVSDLSLLSCLFLVQKRLS